MITEINFLVQQVAGITVKQVEDAIADLRQLRDFLHTEGERVRREIFGYLQLSRAAMDSTKIIVDNIAQWKKGAAGAALPTGRTKTEQAVIASPSPTPSSS